MFDCFYKDSVYIWILNLHTTNWMSQNKCDVHNKYSPIADKKEQPYYAWTKGSTAMTGQTQKYGYRVAPFDNCYSQS